MIPKVQNRAVVSIPDLVSNTPKDRAAGNSKN